MNAITQQEEPKSTVVQLVKQQKAEFSALLKATNTDPERFMNNAIMAIQAKDEIKNGDVSSKSVFAVCSRAAQDGVNLDGKEAAIIIGSVKKGGQWVKEAQYRLMAAGARKIIERSPNIKKTINQVIYENDEFHADFTDDTKPVTHKFTPGTKGFDRGQIMAAYFQAQLADGTWSDPEIMSRAEIELVRDTFGSKDSKMWVSSFGEAARKTVLHRARKYLPLEASQEAALDSMYEGETIDAGAGETPEPDAPKKRTTAAEKVKRKLPAKENYNNDTGEIIDIEPIDENSGVESPSDYGYTDDEIPA